jgi:hypothetical protein
VRAIGADRRGNDDRQRCADTERHADILRHADQTEQFIQHRNQHCAAANAKHTGQNAGDRACRQKCSGQQGQLMWGNSEHVDKLRDNTQSLRPRPSIVMRVAVKSAQSLRCPFVQE